MEESVNFSIKVDPATWQQYISTPIKGKALLLDPSPTRARLSPIAKGTSSIFTASSPRGSRPSKSSSSASTENFREDDQLEKFIFMAGLQDRK
jgi:hypothetical protein